MATSNHARVGTALELLRAGLAPFVEREVDAAIEAGRVRGESLRRFLDDPILAQKPLGEWDVAGLLRLVWELWNEVFREVLGLSQRSLVSELREWRNRWAHQHSFTFDDTYRVLDSAARLLTAVAAPQAEELDRMRQELLRIQFEEQTRAAIRKVGTPLAEAPAAGLLKPWREVVHPHPDVASGRYQQAEFAADLWQVYLGEAAPEYQDPVEFFRRTFLTENLKRLLANAVKRLSGTGGEPVVQLQTNFGGGKTHAMIALYHLFSGKPVTELPGVESILQEAGKMPEQPVRRVVLVGNRISPGSPSVKPDGTVVRTLWGELAWQLGFAAGGIEEARRAYNRVAEDDQRATSPGDKLRELFNDYGPCLVLIDEWVAYARQLHDQPDLPGGTFDTQFTFAQALTESARAARACLLAVSLPASDQPASPHVQAEDVEVGGIRGREALARLRNVIGRIDVPWRPATQEESFEIVRRRLFTPMTDPEQFRDRDLVARAFADLYRTQKGEFPAECSEADYERKLKAAYPIHPELFARLYEDWGSLPTFQRTRGVLRLMATVVHVLWERGDRSPLILPSTIPMEEPRVQVELTRYLAEHWAPVIEKDVDGPSSLPARLDGEHPNLGRYRACRRVARTIFLGSAPTQSAAHRGIEDRRVRLGCVVPGESPQIFGDALRRLVGEARYLYQDGSRYWYAPQPNLTTVAEERAEQLKREPEKVQREVERRVREDVRNPGAFARVHPFPQSPQDVPDDLEARLVILDLNHCHAKGEASEARKLAEQILNFRGNLPRRFRNTLVFLAADRDRAQDLDEAVRRFLAWESVLQDRELLNLTPQQVRQAEQQCQASDGTVKARLPETFIWLLVPAQEKMATEPSWQEIRLQAGSHAQEGLAARASNKLLQNETLLTKLAGNALRARLDEVPLWRNGHVAVQQLVEDFASRLYLPKLRDPQVLLAAVRDGVRAANWREEGFAFAQGFDEASDKYIGVRAGEDLPELTEPLGLVVKPERVKEEKDKGTGNSGSEGGQTPGGGEPPTPPRHETLRRFYAVFHLDPQRVGRDAGRIAEEVIAHLVGAAEKVEVSLEIHAHSKKGFEERVIRTVKENCYTLGVAKPNFEPE